jgi:uncharacterized Zn-finger protein
LSKLQGGANIQVHHSGERAEIYCVNRFVLSKAHIVDNSQYVVASSQLIRERPSLFLVCEICLDEHTWKKLRRTARNTDYRPTLFDQSVGRRAANPLRCTGDNNEFGHERVPLTCEFAEKEKESEHIFSSR